MAILITLQGPDSGRKFFLEAPSAIVGRQLDSDICLKAQAVSRQHAQIIRQGEDYFVEDIGSSNGTYVNGKKIVERVPFTDRDTLQIGPYLFALRPSPTLTTTEPDLIIRERVSAATSNYTLFAQDPAHKLQLVLEIAQHLGRTLDVETLLNKLLDHLMRLFPNADRGMVLLAEGENLVVRAQRCRWTEDASSHPYSRTVVNKALEEGVGLLSEDVRGDARFQISATITSLDLRSLLCVPLICQDGKRLGVIQLDRSRAGTPFRLEDLQLLTALALQVTTVLENASLHAELLREERLRQELAMAREIQQGFLPAEFDDFPQKGFELYARVHPAREVSGDLYDFLQLEDGRVAFFLGDVSGKGMPAALFMIAVRTLARHFALAGESPAVTLSKLNTALAADNPAAMFVTLIHGLYQPATGQLVLASGGHVPPLLRRVDGRVEEVVLQPGRLLGPVGGNLSLKDTQLTLEPGELLVFYTDGFTEAREPAAHQMFDTERMKAIVAGFVARIGLESCADEAKSAVERFTRTVDLQDDMTLLLLRRLAAPAEKATRKLPKIRAKTG